MDLDKIPTWILDLEPEDAGFLKNFVLKSGSLKEIAKLYSVSYFPAFIKELAVDSRIDLETAKLIIEKYQQETGKSNITPLRENRRN